MQRHRGFMLCLKEQSGDCGCMQGGWGGGEGLKRIGDCSCCVAEAVEPVG